MSAVGAALISGGFNLLGGLIGNNQRRKDAYNNSPAGIRANAEAAGFNPLIFAGPSVNSTAGYAPVMGSAIANAGSAIAGTMMEEERLKIERAAIDMDREQLDLEIQRQALTPDVAGIYPRNNGSRSGAENDATTNNPDLVVDPNSSVGAPSVNTRTGYTLGVGFSPWPRASDAETFENRLGDPAQWAISPMLTAGDIGYNIGRAIGDNGPSDYWAKLYENQRNGRNIQPLPPQYQNPISSFSIPYYVNNGPNW